MVYKLVGTQLSLFTTFHVFFFQFFFVLPARYVGMCSFTGKSQKLQNPQWIFHGKLNLFLFMIVVYDSVGDGDKIPKKNLPRFHVTSHLKTEAKVFFS